MRGAWGIVLGVIGCVPGCGLGEGDALVARLDPKEPTTDDDLRIVVDQGPSDLAVTWFRDREEVPDLADSLVVPADRTGVREAWRAELRRPGTPADASPDAVLATVTINRPPTLSVRPPASDVMRPDDIVLEITADDPDGQEVATSVLWAVDGRVLTHVGKGPVASTTDFPPWARWEALVTADDGIVETRVLVSGAIGNAAPEFVESSFGPDPLDGAAEAVASVVVTDPERDRFSVEWTARRGRYRVGTGFGTTATVPLAGLGERGELLTVTFEATDVLGGTSELTVGPLPLPNQLPELNGVRVDGARTVAESGTCTVQATDPDGDALVTEARWYVDGVIVGSGVTLPPLWGRGQQVVCEARVRDDASAFGPWMMSPAITVGNTAPTLSMVRLTPSPARAGDEVRAVTTTPTDADGDPITATVTGWRRAVGWTLYTDPRNVVPAYTATRGDTLRVQVAVTDGAATTTGEILVSYVDTPGVLTPVLVPAGFRYGSAVGVDWSWFDADVNDPWPTLVGVAWWIGTPSSPAAAAPGDPTQLLRRDLPRGTVVGVDVTVEQLGRRVVARTSAQVANTPPGPPTLTWTPARPEAGSDLTCTATPGFDPDGDEPAIFVSLFESGVRYLGGEAVEDGLKVPGPDVVSGSRWTCFVEVDDGTDGVTTASALEVP